MGTAEADIGTDCRLVDAVEKVSGRVAHLLSRPGPAEPELVPMYPGGWGSDYRDTETGMGSTALHSAGVWLTTSTSR